MTVLTNKMYEIFDQEEFSFKKLKVNKTPEEIDTIKQENSSIKCGRTTTDRKICKSSC